MTVYIPQQPALIRRSVKNGTPVRARDIAALEQSLAWLLGYAMPSIPGTLNTSRVNDGDIVYFEVNAPLYSHKMVLCTHFRRAYGAEGSSPVDVDMEISLGDTTYVRSFAVGDSDMVFDTLITPVMTVAQQSWPFLLSGSITFYVSLDDSIELAAISSYALPLTPPSGSGYLP